MLLSLCLTPVTEDRPCGPDLSEEDGEYLNYTITAPDRLPGKYVSPGTGQLFDPASIKIAAEEKPIFSLLKRSKDLRLIAVLAQFRILSGDLGGFAECLEGAAELLTTWWADVHPAPDNGDVEMRELALDVLSHPVRVIAPINYLRLFYDSKLGYVMLRHHRIAGRPEMAYPGEEVPALNDVTKAVTAEEARDEVVTILADAGRCRAAIATILEIWSTNAPSAPPPNVSELDNVLAALETFLKLGAGQSRKPSAGDVATNADQKADAAVGERSGLMQAVRSVFRTDPERAKALKIKSHVEAKAVLVRLEEYFQTKEPSSPSGLLVRQARMLVGRPLIEALEALAPAKVEAMIIQVDKASGFSLGVAKIRALSTSDNSETQAWETKASASTVPIETREDVFLAIQTVEEFLFETEPSSPVPMLLSQARAFMSKDFATIMRELLEKP